MYKYDCFAIRDKNTKYPFCSALRDIHCEGCKFYKTDEQLGNELLKVKKYYESRGKNV